MVLFGRYCAACSVTPAASSFRCYMQVSGSVCEDHTGKDTLCMLTAWVDKGEYATDMHSVATFCMGWNGYCSLSSFLYFTMHFINGKVLSRTVIVFQIPGSACIQQARSREGYSPLDRIVSVYTRWRLDRTAQYLLKDMSAAQLFG